ncbi:phosphotransferase family protein [Bosea sp. (in: a-proteobacteria)]|uniref:phosphotransferase family protein n=1 Tax=Bosea sp. (in: a-proteobacteria) TaxID=1871050 RepID=UPI002616496C|nr:phosphotransferase family protein [Bosea sp. (in: a-proteobacteria)]MCO5089650.1 phosphotransferase family protein [Bosea sp. (in: a-proteobacteria)]
MSGSPDGSGADVATTAGWGTLDHWLASNVKGYGGPATISRFEGGQSNPTYRLDARSGAYVLRRKPSGVLLPSAHAIDREARVLLALADSGVPVAHVHGYCADPAVIGTPFYVMDLVEGRVFWDQGLPELSREERAAIYDSMNETIAKLHTLDPAAVGLEDYGRPGNFMARQISRWTTQYRASETEAIEPMDRLIEWLPAHLPGQESSSIVHGDYRLDNLIIHPSEPRVAAVLDWELSTLGDPLADFTYHVMAWRIPPDVFRGLKGVDLASLGIPDEDTYRASYCARTGRDEIRDWDFYMVYGMFRIAAILQGIAKRARDGNASSIAAAEIGKATRPIAGYAWELARSVGG